MTYPVPNTFDNFIRHLMVDQLRESVLRKRPHKTVRDLLALRLGSIKELAKVECLECEWCSGAHFERVR